MLFHVCSEMTPLAKVGGLADVVHGLCKEVGTLHLDTTIILPFYGSLKKELIDSLTLFDKREFKHSGVTFNVNFWKGEFDEIPLVLIEPLSPYNYFSKKLIYGEDNDIDRFMLFSYLAASYISSLKQEVLVHLHDWPAAFVAPLLKLNPTKEKNINCKIILTIHNLMHQGKADISKLESFGITQKNEFQDPENPNSLNLLKSAMIYADQITTVSPTYAKEILSHEFSYHLDETIWKCKEKTTGILNGIDYDYFNPYSPSKLPFPFPQTPSSECIIQAKKKNKELLQKELGLEIFSKPLFCSITRLDYQKGPNLIAYVSKKIAEHQGQFIILGQATTPYFASIFTSLKELLEPKKNFVYIDKFDEELSKRLFAASDFIFIPSMFEPCGLTQMIGMRFGSIPIARKTGGLIDTVIDFESREAKEEDKTGVTFFEATEQEADKAISRALSLYENKELYKKILFNIVRKDFSWKHSAQEYLKIYDRLQF